MLKEFLAPLVAGQDLTQAEAQEAMAIIMSGQAGEAQIGAFLTALRMKGESSEEITGFAAAMRRYATPLPYSGDGLVDTCGTGGDRKGTFNISTTVAFVAAGAGLRVAKHGNRGVSSPCGSADVLTALGVKVDLSPAAVARCLEEVGVAFLYAPVFHGAMRHAAKPRQELGFRTVFNVLGPLTNPAGASCQLLGVYDAALTEKLAQALAALGCRRAMVVHSLDGLDELSTAAPAQVSEVQDGVVTTYRLDPAAYGFVPPPPGAYRGGTPADNAAITLAVLQGQPGPQRDIVLLNAAAALLVGGVASDLQDGLAQAAASIDSGAALHKLEALRHFSCACEEGSLLL